MTWSRVGRPVSRKRASIAARTDSATRRYVLPDKTTVAWSWTLAAASAALTKAAILAPLRFPASRLAVAKRTNPRLSIREGVTERDQFPLVVDAHVGAHPVRHSEGRLEEHERLEPVPRD